MQTAAQYCVLRSASGLYPELPSTYRNFNDDPTPQACRINLERSPPVGGGKPSSNVAAILRHPTRRPPSSHFLQSLHCLISSPHICIRTRPARLPPPVSNAIKQKPTPPAKMHPNGYDPGCRRPALGIVGREQPTTLKFDCDVEPHTRAVSSPKSFRGTPPSPAEIQWTRSASSRVPGDLERLYVPAAEDIRIYVGLARAMTLVVRHSAARMRGGCYALGCRAGWRDRRSLLNAWQFKRRTDKHV